MGKGQGRCSPSLENQQVRSRRSSVVTRSALAQECSPFLPMDLRHNPGRVDHGLGPVQLDRKVLENGSWWLRRTGNSVVAAPATWYDRGVVSISTTLVWTCPHISFILE